MQETTFAKIRKFGPIKRLKVPFKPGVVKVSGPRASGKTTAMDAIRMIGGASTDGVERRDGALVGTVEAGDLVITLGKTTRRKGEPGIHVIPGADLRELVDPSVKGPEPAAKARIRALASIAQLTVSEEVLLKLVDDNATYARIVKEKFPDLAPGFDTLCKRVKKSLQEAARELKEAADKARGKAEIVEARIDVLEEELDGVKIGDLLAVDALEAEIATSESALVDLRVRANGRAAREETIARLREVHGEKPILDETQKTRKAAEDEVVVKGDHLDVLNKQLKEKRLHFKRLREQHDAEMQQLELERVKREGDLTTATQALVAAGTAHTAKTKAIAEWVARENTLSVEIDGPTQEQVETAQQDLATLRSSYGAAKQAAELAEQKEAAQALETRILTLVEGREALVLTSKSVSSRVADILQKAGLPDITIDDPDRRGYPDVCLVRSDGEVHRFGSRRVSASERTEAAIKVTLAGVDGDELAVLPLDSDGVWWHHLGAETQAVIHEVAVERNVCLVTATTPSGDALRAEVFSPDTE